MQLYVIVSHDSMEKGQGAEKSTRLRNQKNYTPSESVRLTQNCLLETGSMMTIYPFTVWFNSKKARSCVDSP